jgi:hypothetical protein
MYLKVLLANKEYEVGIEDDKIFARCVKCDDEIHVDAEILKEMILEGATFSGTQIVCQGCSKQ